jgi:response regulator RpfG family c-di-GMP phosphodiesterase
MFNEKFDFYSKTTLKSYNLGEKIRDELAMLDSLDNVTRVHSENVANLTCRICEYFGLSKDFTVYCTTAAFLHDIGKVFVKPSVLQKKGKLTDEEYEEIKKHTTIGYEMLYRDLALRPYANVARFHHESLDGSGYPDKLKGKQIPLEAQIVRVADMFDALVAKRQYKTHLDISETLQILVDEVHNGKINKRVVKFLTKVIIDDTLYEISGIVEYFDSVKSNILRLKTAEKYYKLMMKCKNNGKKEKYEYYKNGVEYMLKKNETIDNFQGVLEEFISTIKNKEDYIKKLYGEIKKIKRLKI